MSYNEKGFVLPESIRSCASYHAKIMDSGEYLFRIHDSVEVDEAVEKLETLAAAAQRFANHIKSIKQ